MSASSTNINSSEYSGNDTQSDRSQDKSTYNTYSEATGNNYSETPDNNYSEEEEEEEDYIPTSWFRILEVSENASQKQIVTAYKQKISQYHPDKVAQMGAEIRELAEFKSKQINAAYDYAKKLRR